MPGTCTLVLLALAFANPLYHLNSVGEKICCTLFGNEDVSFEIRQILQKALDDFGVTKSIPLKKMSKSLPNCIQQYSSFTWFGIWINEDQFGQMSSEEKVFAAHHEAAHYKLHHPPLLLTINMSIGILGFGLAYHLQKQYPYAMPVATGLLLSALNPALSKKFELEADKEAILKLLSTNQISVVDYMLNKWQKQLENNDYENHFWLPSLAERIEMITKIS